MDVSKKVESIGKFQSEKWNHWSKQFEYILNLFTLRFGFEKIILFHTDWFGLEEIS